MLVLGQVLAAGVFQEGLQSGNALGAGPGQIDLLRGQGGEYHHFLTGTGYGHIQPPPSAIPVQGTEVHIDLALFVGTVAHGEENHIPFVTLDVFQVFDEERFFYFEGGYRPEKVNFIMRTMMKMLKKSIEKKPEKTEEDLYIIKTFNGADNAKKEAVKPLVEYCIKGGALC